MNNMLNPLYSINSKLCFMRNGIRLLKKHSAVVSFLLFFITILPYSSFAQTRTVSGTVVDSKTAAPVSGATVNIKGTATGTTTDNAGKFSIMVSGDVVLVVSNIGFEPQELTPGSAGTVSVKLVKIDQVLDDVVVIGYGSKKKATLTGSVATVDAKVFQDRGPTANPLAALQGQVPGVVVTRSSAAPGREGWNFQIRGATSTNGTEPLVIVDGIPLVSLNALNSINPADIESMSFLKDGSAAIYGARGAGGVVLITTKTAKAGKPSVQYDGSVSF
jgi:TonB-dependent SusC/RagA subfamily outer membrane receptor